MALGPKTQAYLHKRRRMITIRRDPLKAIAEADSLLARFNPAAQETETRTRVGEELSAYSLQFGAWLAKLDAWVKSTVARNLALLPSKEELRGEPGYTPQKGVDYTDGEKGNPGYTPKADVDYLSAATVRTLVGELTEKAYERLRREGMTKKEILATIIEAVKGTDIVATARALEKLQGAERLSYEALKDRPGVPVEDVLPGRPLYRGGGGVPSLAAGSNITLTARGDGGYTVSATGGSNSAIEALSATQSGDNITLNLTQLANTFTSIRGVYKNGQLLTPGDATFGWSRSGNTITVLNGFDSDSFLVDYNYAS